MELLIYDSMGYILLNYRRIRHAKTHSQLWIEFRGSIYLLFSALVLRGRIQDIKATDIELRS